ncbi:MAG: PAS domain-containing protein [Solidesulfovibrio sp. DCME]|uniref:PAS domain-containing protein n=1 Tax=Solidesulfovibrio sp. DCME TaxID=3447380 RepID=UPI003D13F069
MANLHETPLRDLLPAAPLLFGLWTTAATAARMLLDAGAGEGLVLDGGRPQGVVTTRGLTRVLARDQNRAAHLAARDVMDPVAVSPEGDCLPAALRHMLAAPSRRLAVVDATGKALGVLAPFHVARLAAACDELTGRTVASVMARAVVMAAPDEPLAEVLARMQRLGVGGVVVAAGDRPRGMFTARDAVGIVAGRRGIAKLSVASVMRAPVVAVSPQLPLTEAIRGMDGAGAGRLAVTDAAGYLVGLLTWTDVAQALSQVLSEGEGGALRERAELFRDLYDNAAQGLFRLDSSGRPLAANKTMARFLGFRDVADLLRQARHPSHPLRLDTPERRELLVRALAQPDPVSFEAMVYRQDGTARRIACQARAVRDSVGSPRYLEGACVEMPDCEAAGGPQSPEDGCRAIVESQSDYLCRLDADRRLVFANTAYARCFGLTPQACLGLPFVPDIAPEDAARREARLGSLCPARPATSFEHRVLRPDGRERWQRWSCRAFFDEAGKAVGYICQGRDVTARRRAQQMLRNRLAKATALLDSLPLPVFAKDARGLYTASNPAFEDLVGMSREQLYGKRLEELMPPLEPEDYEAQDKRLLDKGGRQVYEAGFRTAAGPRRLRIRKAVIRDAETGAAVGIAGVAMDVTERRRVEVAAAKVRETLEADLVRVAAEREKLGAAREKAEIRWRGLEQFLNIVLLAVADGVCVLSPDMVILSANRALRAMYPDRGEMVGRKCHDVFHGLGMPCQDCPSIRALATRKLAMSVVPKNESGKQVGWVELFSYPLLDEEGEISGVVEIVRDVTAGRKLEAELAAALERAEAASQAKGAFLANMSHEIRTPLNAVLGYVQLMRGDRLETRQRERLAVVEESAAALLSIINDILDYSKIEAGRMELKAETFDLERCLEAVLKEQEVLAHEKRLALVLAIGPEVPRTIRGDGLRLRQVLRNLVNNAVKYTEQGGVTLRAERLGEAPSAEPGGGRVTLRLSVADTGVGIAPQQQETIFDSFTQVDTGLTKRQAGTGLGLAICRRLAGLMGGEVHLRSTPGRGSTFWLDCPFEVEAAAPRQIGETPFPACSASPSRLRILLVEDNRVNRLFAADLLESRGHEVVVAENGRAALEFLAAERVDVVLMDIQMPVMDGLTATRAIRAGHMNIDPNLPVIGLSAYAMDQERERFLAAGLDDYITKPIDVDGFFLAVREVLAHRGRLPAGDGAAREEKAFDAPALFRLYRDKTGLLVRVGREFVASVPEQVNALELAAGEGDMRVCERVAHTLKGNAAMFGAKVMRMLAAEMEVAAAAGDVARVRGQVPGLRQACREVVAGMDAYLRRLEDQASGL